MMKLNDKSWFAMVVLVAVTEAPGVALGASFSGLGDLAGGGGSLISSDPGFESRAGGVSPNGGIVVGSSVTGNPPEAGNGEAFKWSAGGGIVGIGFHSTGIFYASAGGVTNGDVAAGIGDTDVTNGMGYGQVLRWAAPSGSTSPEPLPLDSSTFQNWSSFSGNHPIDGSGDRIVGYITETPGTSDEASVWVNGMLKHLGWLAPGPMLPPPNTAYRDYSYANAINTPGTHIVGSSLSGTFAGDEADPAYTPQQAVLWHDPTGTWATPPAAQGLGQIGGIGVGSGSTAQDITTNGTTFVGAGCTTANCDPVNGDVGQRVALRGTVGNTNLTAMGALPVNDPSVVASSLATAIAGDGTTVVGWSSTDVPILEPDEDPIELTGRTAFIWDPMLTGGEIMSLKEYLVNEQGLGAALAGWTLKEATDISDDGTVIVGTGVNPDGNYEAFRAVIDFSAGIPGDYNSNGLVDAADYTVWRDNLGSSTVLPNESATPGMVTPEDYDVWKTNFGMSGSGASFSSGSAAVPEPVSVPLLLTGAGLCLTAARGHSRYWKQAATRQPAKPLTLSC